MSEQQLDQIHDTLVKYVEEKPFSVPLLGTNQTIAEAQRNHAEFCKKTIPNEPIYGRRTYGEAEEMNKSAVPWLDAIDKIEDNYKEIKSIITLFTIDDSKYIT